MDATAAAPVWVPEWAMMLCEESVACNHLCRGHFPSDLRPNEEAGDTVFTLAQLPTHVTPE